MHRVQTSSTPAGREVLRRCAFLALAGALMWVMATPAASASATTDRIGPFASSVIVNDDPFSAAIVQCDSVRRTERPDGTSIETQHCEVVELLFGEMPTTGFVGEILSTCEWASDYWQNTTGEVLFADRGRVVIAPSGAVNVVTHYRIDPDDLENCGFG